MPLVRIDLRKGKSEAYREQIGLIVHEAMISVGVPKDDRLRAISEHEPPNFVFDPNYLGIRHSEDLAMVQITWNEGRTSSRRRRSTRRSPTGLRASSAYAARTSSSA